MSPGLSRLRILAAWLVATCLCVASWPALASPLSTVWIEDVFLQPSGPAELALGYERQEELAGTSTGTAHLFTLRAAVGFDRAPMDFAPEIGLVQLGDGATRLDRFGLRIRYRLAGTTGQPIALATLGYRIQPGSDSSHAIEEGVAVRWARRELALAGDVHVREDLGGPSGTSVEFSLGAAITYGAFLGYLSMGAEAFAVIPVAGSRIVDAPVGSGSEDFALYAGPTVRISAESLWLAVGVATGKLTDSGSPVLVRALLGTQF